jgi:hypothetical protein
MTLKNEKRSAHLLFVACSLSGLKQIGGKKQANLHNRAMTAPTGAALMRAWSASAVA